MRTIIYGYKMVNGKIIIDETEASQIRDAFNLYLNGTTLNQLGHVSGINRNHTAMNNLLQDARYKGNEIYPRIVDDELFELVAEKRNKEKAKHAWIPKRKPLPKASMQFTLNNPSQKYDDPFMQARYIYGLIKKKEA